MRGVRPESQLNAGPSIACPPPGAAVVGGTKLAKAETASSTVAIGQQDCLQRPCSWCGHCADHVMLRERAWHGKGRPTFRCAHCGELTTTCKVVACPNMAREHWYNARGSCDFSHAGSEGL